VEGVSEKPKGKRGRELDTHEVDLFFESHIKDGGKLEELAAKLYLSKGQLNRLLREKYGMTFREKLLRARMGQAARLLRYTDMPIFKVAEEVGYTATSSFYHVFRDWHGMTPENYRQSNRPAVKPEE
jgi:two-component system response regulator YesN